jgi:RIP metalloprotease RseP
MPSWLYAVLFILSILAVVMIHEAGHFFTARAFGIKVEEFFVGFGPRLWSVRRGETEYGVKLLPFGGYVRIAGMNPFQEIPESERPRTFGAKPAWQRAVVIGTGPVTHFAIVFLLLAGFLMTVGVPAEDRPMVDAVETRILSVGPSDSGVGPQPDDLILQVDGRTFAGQGALVDYLASRSGDEVVLQVARGDARLDVPAVASNVQSPAVTAGLQPGDEVVAVDGSPAGTIDEVIGYTREHVGETISVTVIRDGREMTVSAEPALSPIQTASAVQLVGRFGVGLGGVRERTNPIAAVGRGVVETGRITGAVVGQLGDVFGPSGLTRIWRLLTGEESRTSGDVVSVVGAVRLASDAGRAGAWIELFNLLVVLNVFVGIVNFVPLPPLDGGHLAVVVYEVVRRRKADYRKLAPLSALVAGFLILFSLSVVYLDIVQPPPSPFR